MLIAVHKEDVLKEKDNGKTLLEERAQRYCKNGKSIPGVRGRPVGE